MLPLTFVPGLPVLSSSSDVGDSQHSPQMSDKDESGDAVAWRDGDVKTTVTIQKTWMGAVQFDALLVNDKHGDLSAVLGGIEDLTKTWMKTELQEHKQDWKQSQELTQMGATQIMFMLVLMRVQSVISFVQGQ